MKEKEIVGIRLFALLVLVFTLGFDFHLILANNLGCEPRVCG